MREVPLAGCSVRITTDDAELHERCAYVEHGAELAEAPARVVEVEARREREGWRIHQDGDDGEVEGSVDVALAEVYRRAYWASFDHLPVDAVLLHGIVAGTGRGHLLIVGAAGAGKSTLATHLSLGGRDVQGDEYAVLHGGVLTTIPRRFHLKPPSLAHLPAVAAIAESLPYVEVVAGAPVLGYSPARERTWHLHPAPLAGVVVLVANHGGATRLEEATPLETARAVMGQTFVAPESGSAWISAVCEVVDAVPAFRLVLGDVETASVALDQLFQ